MSAHFGRSRRWCRSIPSASVLITLATVFLLAVFTSSLYAVRGQQRLQLPSLLLDEVVQPGCNGYESALHRSCPGGGAVGHQPSSHRHVISVNEDDVSQALQWRLSSMPNTSAALPRDGNSGPRAWMCTAAGSVFEDVPARFHPSPQALQSCVVGYTTFSLPKELCRRPVITLAVQGKLVWPQLGADDSCIFGVDREPIASIMLLGEHTQDSEEGVMRRLGQCFTFCMSFRSCSAFTVEQVGGDNGGDIQNAVVMRCSVFRCLPHGTPRATMRERQLTQTTVSSAGHVNELFLIMHERRMILEPSWFRDEDHPPLDSSTRLYGREQATGNGDGFLLLLRSFGGLVWFVDDFDVALPSEAQVVVLDGTYADVRNDVDGTVELRVIAIPHPASLSGDVSRSDELQRRWGDPDDISDTLRCRMWREVGKKDQRAPHVRAGRTLGSELFRTALPLVGGRARLNSLKIRNVRPFLGSTLCIVAEMVDVVSTAAGTANVPLQGVFAIKAVRLHAPSTGVQLLPTTGNRLTIVEGHKCGAERETIGVWCIQDSLRAVMTTADAVVQDAGVGAGDAAAAAYDETTTTTGGGSSSHRNAWGAVCFLKARIITTPPPSEQTKKGTTTSNNSNGSRVVSSSSSHPAVIGIELLDGWYTKFGPFGDATFEGVLFRLTSSRRTFDAAALNQTDNEAVGDVLHTFPATQIGNAEPLVLQFDLFMHDDPHALRNPATPVATWSTTLERFPSTASSNENDRGLDGAKEVDAAVGSVPATTPVLISIAVHECAECLVPLLANIRTYASPCMVVLHLSPPSSGGTIDTTQAQKYIILEARLFSERQMQSNASDPPMRLAVESMMKVFINSKRTTSSSPGLNLHVVHIRNAAFMLHHHPDTKWSHIVWVQSNERFLKHGLVTYVQRFESSVPRVTSPRAGITFLHSPGARFITVRELLSTATHYRSSQLMQLRDGNRRATVGCAESLYNDHLQKLPRTTLPFRPTARRLFFSQNIFSEGIFFNRDIAQQLIQLLEAAFDDYDSALGDPFYISHEYTSALLLYFVSATSNHNVAPPPAPAREFGQRTSYLGWLRTDYFVTLADIQFMRRSPLLPPFSAKRFPRDAPQQITNVPHHPMPHLFHPPQ